MAIPKLPWLPNAQDLATSLILQALNPSESRARLRPQLRLGSHLPLMGLSLQNYHCLLHPLIHLRQLVTLLVYSNLDACL